MPPELKADADHPAGDGPAFWRSVEEWMDSPKFREMMRDEFPEDAAEWLDPVSRRQFLQLAGASAALAGAVGCNPSLKPASQRKVLPYVNQPTDVLPNVPLFFATAMPQAGGVGVGLLARSHEGRPTKVEPNPNHPSSAGGSNVLAQASVLGLYDPDRSKEIRQRGVATTYEKAVSEIKKALAAQKDARGAGVRLVTEPTTSPTLIRVVKDFLAQYPDAKWVQYEPVARENARQGLFQAFGRHAAPVYDLAKADVVLSLDADFLSAAGPGGPRYARDFAARRKVRTGHAAHDHKDGVPVEEMNRLYVVESMPSPTGGKADHRLPLKPSEVELFARAVAAKLGVAGVAAGELPKAAEGWIAPLVADLQKHKGKALVVVGDEQPAAVHQIGWAINQALGAVGSVVRFVEPLDGRPADKAGDSFAEFKAVAEDAKAGKVAVLLLLNANPLFDAPADLEFAKAVTAVRDKGVVVHLGSHFDETAREATYHVNSTHYLETWGDVRAHDGTVTVQQPLIAPIFGGKSALELMSSLIENPASPYEAVRATWEGWHKNPDNKQSGDFNLWWDHGVKDGVLPGTAPAAVAVAAAKTDGLGAAPSGPKAGEIEVQFKADPTLYDGRFATNGWLQELPKPVTKLTWDNAAIVSPATAVKIGAILHSAITGDTGMNFGWSGGENGRAIAPVVKLTVNGRTLDAVAVLILPGHADDAITLHVGHGRASLGAVPTTGFNAYKLRTSDGLWVARGAKAEATGSTYTLATTNSYYAMEGRRPVRTATVAEFKKDHDFAQVPAATPGEYKEIRALTPGTEEEWERLYGKEKPYPHHDDHDHGHKHDEHEPHDKRVIPLSLYPDYPNRVQRPDGTVDQASKAYRRWGMVIDLNACTGCSTCVAACVSENNIPVVGKEQVTRGRAMHWVRIDRYFSIPGESSMDDRLGGRDVRGKDRFAAIQNSAAVKTHFQPVMCVQCEKAPCEVVCPVNATAHSADGLNDMVYNRCVGTRYCSNNCPYKVRRFNFLQFADYQTESLKLVNNPEVTVRQRGVMEKCTYCVQRIRNAEIEAEREFQTRPKDANGRPKIKDGEVVTACQSACPTGAIVFGDINDPESAVLRGKAEAHGYGLLAELNTMPRTSYLAEIRNVNPDMPKGA